jgi:hypothetical protein
MGVLSSLAQLALSRGGTIAVAAGVAALGVGGLTLATLANGGLKPDKFSGTNSTFPDDLANLDHWMSFTAVQTNGLGADVLKKYTGIEIGSNFKTPGGSAFLPIPSNLSTDYKLQYSDSDMSAAAAQTLKIGDRALYGNQGDMNTAAAAGGALMGVAAQAAIAGTGAGGVAKALGLNADAGAAALKVGAGIALNPNKIVLFTGVPFREHTFSWKLSPKNRNESDTINSMIRMFRYYSHPEYVAGGLFFKYPEFFQIRFNYPEYLFDLRPSVCTDVKVNYHSQGYAGYVRDKNGGGIPAPVEIELSLSFKETEIITKNSLDSGFN